MNGKGNVPIMVWWASRQINQTVGEECSVTQDGLYMKDSSMKENCMDILESIGVGLGLMKKEYIRMALL